MLCICGFDLVLRVCGFVHVVCACRFAIVLVYHCTDKCILPCTMIISIRYIRIRYGADHGKVSDFIVSPCFG